MSTQRPLLSSTQRLLQPADAHPTVCVAANYDDKFAAAAAAAADDLEAQAFAQLDLDP